jgi:hypothetical protein
LRLVKVISTALSKIKHEIFKDDLAEDRIFSVVECVPIKDQKVLKLKLEGGETIIIPGEILSTSLTPGEKKVRSTDENGNEKASTIWHDDGTVETKNDAISMTIDANGKIEIKNLNSDDLVKLISDLSANLQAAVTDLISATVPTMLGPQMLSVSVPWAIPVTGLLAKTIDTVTKINFYKK